MEIEISKIKPSPYQPRTVFDIDELKDSISTNGLLMPLTVRKVKDYFELIDGDRRLHALKALKMQMAKCSVIDVSDSIARKMVWKINKDRADYTTEEEARFLLKLSKTMTFYEIGKELNENDQWVLANINVFKFAPDIQQAVWCGKLTVSHIKELEPIIGAGQIDKADKVLREAIDRKLTAKETREASKDMISKVEDQRLEAAKKAVSQIPTIGAGGPTPVDLDSPLGLEKAAQALKKAAKKKRELTMTPAEIQKQKEERRQRTAKATETAKQKIKSEVKEEAKREAREELLQDPDVRRQILESAPQTTISATEEEESAIPSTDEQLDQLFERIGQIKLPAHQTSPAELEQINREYLRHILTLVATNHLHCPKCKNNKLQWVCGHNLEGK